MADPVVVESWHLPRALSDEALRLLTRLPMEEIERRLRMDGPAGHERPTDEQLDDLFVEIDGSGETQSWRAFARAVLARWGAADGEVIKGQLISGWLPIDSAPRDGTEILASDYDAIEIVAWGERQAWQGLWSDRDGRLMLPSWWQPLPEHPPLQEVNDD